MRIGSYMAATAVLGLMMLGCDRETETNTPATGEDVQNQVDRATDALRQETRDLGNTVRDQANEAGANLNERMQAALEGVDAETRQQFQQLQSAIQEKNWDDARTALGELNAKRADLTEQGRQLLDSLRAQIPAGD